MKNSLILLMAGSGSRLGLGFNKTLYKINNIPLFLYSLKTFVDLDFDEFILVVAECDKEEVKTILDNYSFAKNITMVEGSTERYLSVKNAVKVATGDRIFIHDAARPLINKEDVKNLMNSTHKVGTLCEKSSDTLRYVNEDGFNLVDRNHILKMSTPQFFDQSLLSIILNNNDFITDEISLFNNYDVDFVIQNHPNPKLTYEIDLDYINFLINGNKKYFIGHSLDYHPFSNSDKKLVLGGVTFADYPILEGHSDADVVYHAVTEAIMGACCLGDLGTLFPDNDPKYKGINSGLLLKEVMERVKNKGLVVENIDVMVYLIKPKLVDYKKQMIKNIVDLTNCKFVCVKAATLNKRGLISTGEGIGSEATVLVSKNSN